MSRQHSSSANPTDSDLITGPKRKVVVVNRVPFATAAYPVVLAGVGFEILDFVITFEEGQASIRSHQPDFVVIAFLEFDDSLKADIHGLRASFSGPIVAMSYGNIELPPDSGCDYLVSPPDKEIKLASLLQKLSLEQ
jgi:hypothetical protein